MVLTIPTVMLIISLFKNKKARKLQYSFFLAFTNDSNAYAAPHGAEKRKAFSISKI